MEPKNLVTEQSPPELWDTVDAKAKAPGGSKQVLVRSVEEIRKAARHAIDAGADWWQFHEHTDTT